MLGLIPNYRSKKGGHVGSTLVEGGEGSNGPNGQANLVIVHQWSSKFGYCSSWTDYIVLYFINSLPLGPRRRHCPLVNQFVAKPKKKFYLHGLVSLPSGPIRYSSTSFYLSDPLVSPFDEGSESSFTICFESMQEMKEITYTLPFQVEKSKQRRIKWSERNLFWAFVWSYLSLV